MTTEPRLNPDQELNILARRQRAVDDLQDKLGHAITLRNDSIIGAHDEGVPVAHIAEVAGVSRQHVHKIITRAQRAEGGQQ